MYARHGVLKLALSFVLFQSHVRGGGDRGEDDGENEIEDMCSSLFFVRELSESCESAKTKT